MPNYQCLLTLIYETNPTSREFGHSKWNMNILEGLLLNQVGISVVLENCKILCF